MVEVRYCKCDCPAQDKLYGKGRRVHNRTKQSKPESQRGWRCSGCGKDND